MSSVGCGCFALCIKVCCMYGDEWVCLLVGSDGRLSAGVRRVPWHKLLQIYTIVMPTFSLIKIIKLQTVL